MASAIGTTTNTDTELVKLLLIIEAQQREIAALKTALWVAKSHICGASYA